MRSKVRAGREPGTPARRLVGKVAASIATVAVAGGLMAFAHYGGFADGHDPFPHSVVAHP